MNDVVGGARIINPTGNLWGYSIRYIIQFKAKVTKVMLFV